jgi:hypothetical protein
MNEHILDNYGYSIADNHACSLAGNLKDIDSIIIELQEVYNNFSTHSMNESTLYLQGQKSMLAIIIDYLKRV